MSGYEVTLAGTWVRADTWPSDITMMRRQSYTILRRYLNRCQLATANGQPAPKPPPVRFSLTAKHARSTRLAQPREGTFEATIFLSSEAGFIAHRSRVSRAKTLLKWFLQDATCRPPVLSFDNEPTVKLVR